MDQRPISPRDSPPAIPMHTQAATQDANNGRRTQREHLGPRHSRNHRDTRDWPVPDAMAGDTALHPNGRTRPAALEMDSKCYILGFFFIVREITVIYTLPLVEADLEELGATPRQILPLACLPGPMLDGVEAGQPRPAAPP